jgi:predicted nuclease of predicted toxin-antitoxin system
VKLLFDENLSRRLVKAISGVYPGSAHVFDRGLERADDKVVWDHAKADGFAIVTKDMDFHQRAVLHGPPPRVVWIRLGNCTTKKIETLLRMRAADRCNGRRNLPGVCEVLQAPREVPRRDAALIAHTPLSRKDLRTRVVHGVHPVRGVHRKRSASASLRGASGPARIVDFDFPYRSWACPHRPRPPDRCSLCVPESGAAPSLGSVSCPTAPNQAVQRHVHREARAVLVLPRILVDRHPEELAAL